MQVQATCRFVAFCRPLRRSRGPPAIGAHARCALACGHATPPPRGGGQETPEAGMARFRVALAQMDTTVGDVAGNIEKMAARLEDARAAGADLVAFPELAVSGYPPEDLLLK